MPNIKSAAKRMRTSEKARLRNRMVKSRLRTLRTRFLEALSGTDAAKRQAAWRAYVSAVDRAARKGIIPRQRADRCKRRAAKRLAAAAPVAPAAAPAP